MLTAQSLHTLVNAVYSAGEVRLPLTLGHNSVSSGTAVTNKANTVDPPHNGYYCHGYPIHTLQSAYVATHIGEPCLQVREDSLGGSSDQTGV